MRLEYIREKDVLQALAVSHVPKMDGLFISSHKETVVVVFKEELYLDFMMVVVYILCDTKYQGLRKLLIGLLYYKRSGLRFSLLNFLWHNQISFVHLREC